MVSFFLLVVTLLLFQNGGDGHIGYFENTKWQKQVLRFDGWEPRSDEVHVDLEGHWGDRLELHEIYDRFLEKLVAVHNQTITLKTIGTTNGKKLSIYSIELQRSVNKGGTVFIDAAQNGNEWLSVNMVLYIIFRLLKDHMSLFLWLRIVVVPVVNPDGYDKAKHETDYSLNNNQVGSCPGVDIAWNFKVGPTPNPPVDPPHCPQYQGHDYESEVETQAIVRYFEELGDVKLYISFHTGKPFIAYPYAYQKKSHRSKQVAKEAYRAIKEAMNFEGFGVGTLAERTHELYGGAAVDWAADVMNVKDCLHVTIDNTKENVEEMFDAFFQGIKRALARLQVTDVDVGKAFVKECNLTRKGVRALVSSTIKTDINFTVRLCTIFLLFSYIVHIK